MRDAACPLSTKWGGGGGAGGRRASWRKSGSLKARSRNAWPSRVYARITFAEHAVQLGGGRDMPI